MPRKPIKMSGTPPRLRWTARPTGQADYAYELSLKLDGARYVQVLPVTEDGATLWGVHLASETGRHAQHYVGRAMLTPARALAQFGYWIAV